MILLSTLLSARHGNVIRGIDNFVTAMRLLRLSKLRLYSHPISASFRNHKIATDDNDSEISRIELAA